MEFTGVRFRDVTLSISKQAAGKNVRIVHVDMLRGSIKPKRGEVRHSYWNARMYGGIIHMDATVSTSKGAQQRVSARLKMDNIQVQPLVADVAGIEKVSGMLSSTLDIEATGKIMVKNGSQLEGKIIPSGLPGLLGITMLVSGTLEHPEMRPAPPDMKGAAVPRTIHKSPR